MTVMVAWGAPLLLALAGLGPAASAGAAEAQDRPGGGAVIIDTHAHLLLDAADGGGDGRRVAARRLPSARD
jgi:hypothetical protein